MQPVCAGGRQARLGAHQGPPHRNVFHLLKRRTAGAAYSVRRLRGKQDYDCI